MPLSILSVMHVNVNCSDLAQSLAFYRDVVGLNAQDHTNPVPQDGAGFGMSGAVQWDAHILQDARGYGGPAIDLLQWLVPAPVGAPGSEPNHLGFNRLCVHVPDVDAVYRRAIAAGCECESAPVTTETSSVEKTSAKTFLCRDPDGTAVEFVEVKGTDHPKLNHVNVNCSDAVRSREWYEGVLGLEARLASAPGNETKNAYGRSGDIDWTGHYLWPPGQDTFAIELIEWKTPPPVGRPAASANQIGLYRMAFMVADIHSAHEEIVAQGVECGPPVFLDMGPEIPVDGVWALFFPDPDGTCMELIETPKLNA